MIKKFTDLNEGLNRPLVTISTINQLKNVTSLSMRDFAGGQRIFWILKKIILDQEDRIKELEYKIAELKGEVQPDEEG